VNFAKVGEVKDVVGNLNEFLSVISALFTDLGDNLYDISAHDLELLGVS
jgi:hypothetical protein